MRAFKGRSSLKQSIPNKPIERGFRCLNLACSKTGYILKSDVYTRASGDDVEDSLGTGVVMNLTRSLEGKGHIITMDNFFSSPELFERMYNKGIYTCGTVSSNRREETFNSFFSWHLI